MVGLLHFLHLRPRTPATMAGAWLLLLAAALVFTSELNQSWMLWAHRQSSFPPWLWASLNVLGTGASAIVLLLSVARTDLRLPVATLCLIVMVPIATNAFKSGIAQPRPDRVLEPAQLSVIGPPAGASASMPSGHSTTVAAALAMAWLARPLVRRPLLWLALLGLAAMAAWARVAVGAHWPADVLAGAGLGILLAWTSWWASAAAPRFSDAMAWRTCCAVAALELSASAWLLLVDTGYAQAYWLQWALAALGIGSAARRLRQQAKSFMNGSPSGRRCTQATPETSLDNLLPKGPS